MRRGLLIAGLVLAALILAGIGAALSFVSSIRSRITSTPSLVLERSTAL
jgi:hypothetical protein